jgi:hypothetical protein
MQKASSPRRAVPEVFVQVAWLQPIAKAVRIQASRYGCRELSF